MSMRLSTVATAFALLAIPALASAHGGVPYSTPNVIHGCRNPNGVLRQVTSGGCGGDVVVHWNITGPEGPIGPGGPRGPAGATGATGAPGANGTNGTNGIDGTRAAGPCFDNNNRYVDCGNGTVTDTVTGLIWLQQADCLGNANYSAANQAAAALANLQCGLTDGSSAGDWRLPTKDEWSATIARAVALGCTGLNGPSLTNDAGNGCLFIALIRGGTSFAGVASELYWSSTSNETLPSVAWLADLFISNVNFTVKDNTLRVWPVRGGPQ